MRPVSLLLSLFLLLPRNCAGQDWAPSAPAYKFINTAADTITGSAFLRPFIGLLHAPRAKSGGNSNANNRSRVLRIVHIGDSHTQADMMTGVVRRGLQEQFGDAGRGLVFPYQVAGSNAPVDLLSSFSSKWGANRLAHPEIPIECGISGFGLHSTARGSAFVLGLKPNNSNAGYFDRVRLFTVPATDKDCPGLQPWEEEATYRTVAKDSFGYTVQFSGPIQRFEVTACNHPFSFYGASLEKNADTGILYHTIGVNGAQYSQYNATPLFWKQLPALQADLFVVSLGTNEAQKTVLDRTAFRAHIVEMVSKLRRAAPGALIMLTTPAGSHTREGKPNAVLDAVSAVIRDVCSAEKLSCWDLYTISGGYRSAASWKNSGLMAKDGIHYNAAGYRLQGLLFLRALANAYNAKR